MTHTLQQETAGHRPRHRRRGAAAYVRDSHDVPCTEATLATLASRGGGPPFFLFGRIPIYPEEGLDEWVKARLGEPVRSTSEARSLATRAVGEDGENEDEAKAYRTKAAPSRTVGPRRRKVSVNQAGIGTDAPAQ
jgi:hypothetical protein